jgi:hypothetical protein
MRNWSPTARRTRQTDECVTGVNPRRRVHAWRSVELDLLTYLWRRAGFVPVAIRNAVTPVTASRWALA